MLVLGSFAVLEHGAFLQLVGGGLLRCGQGAGGRAACTSQTLEEGADAVHKGSVQRLLVERQRSLIEGKRPGGRVRVGLLSAGEGGDEVPDREADTGADRADDHHLEA